MIVEEKANTQRQSNIRNLAAGLADRVNRHDKGASVLQATPGLEIHLVAVSRAIDLGGASS